MTETATKPVRGHTPDVVTTDEHGRTATEFTLKRYCNGCDAHLGDLEDWDITDTGGLVDARGECPNCAPLVALEKAGCRTWRVTERNIDRVADEIDRLRPWVYTKGFFRPVGPEQHLAVVGLRVGEGRKRGEERVVAFFGDWLVRHPGGRYSVHKAPAVDQDSASVEAAR